MILFNFCKYTFIIIIFKYFHIAATQRCLTILAGLRHRLKGRPTGALNHLLMIAFLAFGWKSVIYFADTHTYTDIRH